jgi:putative transcription factor
MTQSCDLCGKPDAKFKAKIAGMEAIVCPDCASHGSIIEEIKEEKPKEIQRRIEKKKKETIKRTEDVVEDIGDQVRAKREELGLKQEELAKKIKEHASMVKRIEHGYLPSLKISHKLEKVLHINLTEYTTASDQEYTQSTKGGVMTLGDMMVIRKGSQKGE